MAGVDQRFSACLIDVYETVVTCDFSMYARELQKAAGVSPELWHEAFVTFGAAVTDGRSSMADVYSWALRATGEEPRDDRVRGLVRMDEELLFEYTCLHEDAVPFLEMLKMRGVASALVSNCAENTRSLLERLGLAGLVDGMVLSCEIGRAKPSPEIYRRALDLLGVEAATTVFVDDQTAYCEGAEAIGITALQISRHGVPEGKVHSRTITSLLELDSVL